MKNNGIKSVLLFATCALTLYAQSSNGFFSIDKDKTTNALACLIVGVTTIGTVAFFSQQAVVNTIRNHPHAAALSLGIASGPCIGAVIFWYLFAQEKKKSNE